MDAARTRSGTNLAESGATEILYVRSLFRPADFGGNRYPWEVTRRLALAGHRVRVVTPRPEGPLPGPTPVELVYYPASRRTPLETFFTNALFSRVAVEREMRRRHVDIVALSSYEVSFGHYTACPPRVPTVFIYHSSFYSDAVNRLASARWPRRLAHRPLAAFVHRVEELTFRSATRLVAVSPFSRAEIEARLGSRSDRIDVIPTGVDTDLFRPGDRAAARARLGLALDAKVLLTVGRLSRVKRYDRAIDVVRLQLSRDPRYLLLIVGKGPEEDALRATASPLGVAVRFLGFRDGAALRDAYLAADVTLCTSDFENWSLSILESLACGTPVVGTPRGSIPDMLRPVDASLVSSGTDPENIAATASRLVESDGMLADLGLRARSFVAERYSWDRTADGLVQCFDKAIEEHQRQARRP